VAVSGHVEALAEPLLHHSYRGLDDFVARSNRYSTLAAVELMKRGHRLRWTDLTLRPFARFFSMYVVKMGFLDGWRGFVLAVLYANYVFLRMAKAWESRRAGREDSGAP
jgi:hypothetical protein